MALPMTSIAVACTSIALAWPSAACAEQAMDANLVTALDTSDSIMRHEEWIQLDGMRRAIAHPAFLAAIRAGRHRRVGFTAFTWSSDGDRRVVVPWTVLDSAVDIERVTQVLAKMPRRTDLAVGGDQDRHEAPQPPDRLTDVSEALRYGLDQLVAAPHRAERLILNICGNGSDNVGEGPERVRDLVLAAGVSINGLVIGGKAGLATYYRDRVAGGPGSFVIEAREPGAIADAMLRKFLLDLLSVNMRGDRRMAWAGSHQARPPAEPCSDQGCLPGAAPGSF